MNEYGQPENGDHFTIDRVERVHVRMKERDKPDFIQADDGREGTQFEVMFQRDEAGFTLVGVGHHKGCGYTLLKELTINGIDIGWKTPWYKTLEFLKGFIPND